MPRPGQRTTVTDTWGPAETVALDRCLAWGPSIDRPVRSPPAHLVRVIESEIIPRLLLASGSHAGCADAIAVDARSPITPLARTVAQLAVAGGSAAVLAEVATERERGSSLEAILLDVLAPAARHLGDLWVDDLCTFTDVTLGLAALQQTLRSLGPAFRSEGTDRGRGRILLAPVPGEQHSFGWAMLEEFFRRAGWDVEGGADWTAADLAGCARDVWFDAVGLSLYSGVLFHRVRPAIDAIRRASLNPSVLVLVGGRYFADHPELVAQTGADATASDAPDALLRASSVVLSPLASVC